MNDFRRIEHKHGWKSLFPLCIGAVNKFCLLLGFEGSVPSKYTEPICNRAASQSLADCTIQTLNMRWAILEATVSLSESLLLFIFMLTIQSLVIVSVIDDSFPVWFNSIPTTPEFDLHISASAVSQRWLNTWKVEAFKHFDHVRCSPSKTLTLNYSTAVAAETWLMSLKGMWQMPSHGGD